jgi:KDO2-lipid IV(A) lauroyltransferase
MNTFQNKIQDMSASSFFLSIGKTLYRLSPAQRLWWGGVLGNALRWLSPSRARITLDNLSRAYPDAPASWLRSVQRGAYHNLGVTLLEILIFPHLTPGETRAMVEFRNLHLIEEAYQEKQGIVLISGHYGNWELVAFALPLVVDLPISVIVTEQANKHVDTLLHWYRSRTGNSLIPMDKAARQIIACLKRGEAVAMLADQAATPETDVFVPFFGHLACTYEAPAALTLRYNAPMIVGFAERKDDGRYIVELQRIRHDDLKFDKEGLYRLTLRHVAALEEAVRRRPGLWAWQHKRWKHTPPDAAPHLTFESKIDDAPASNNEPSEESSEELNESNNPENNNSEKNNPEKTPQ